MTNNVYLTTVYFLFCDRWNSCDIPLATTTPVQTIIRRVLQYLKVADNPKNNKLISITEVEYKQPIGL